MNIEGIVVDGAACLGYIQAKLEGEILGANFLKCKGDLFKLCIRHVFPHKKPKLLGPIGTCAR